MKTKSYAITPEKLAAAAAELKAEAGITIDPAQTVGCVELHGVKLGWTNSGTELAVTIESKPFYVPESAVWGPLDKAFA